MGQAGEYSQSQPKAKTESGGQFPPASGFCLTEGQQPFQGSDGGQGDQGFAE